MGSMLGCAITTLRVRHGQELRRGACLTGMERPPLREWRLVPEWRWAIGRPADLAAVWKNYRIEVKVTTSRINGIVTYGIDHTEAAYVLDATGHERALFAWPFNPQDVEQELRQLH
jgi:cytochrome oxidase Cu insertion factor (SCO1/SenC/PrrC family)